MDINEISDKLYQMNQEEIIGLVFYMLGYAKQDAKFRKEFTRVVSSRYDHD